MTRSIEIVRGSRAQALGLGTLALTFQAAHLGGQSGPGLAARAGGNGCPADQLNQALKGSLAVLFLRAVLAGVNEQHAIRGDAAACQLEQPEAHIIRQRSGIEPKLRLGGDLVHVLPAWTRTLHKVHLNVRLVDRNRVSNLDHMMLP